MAGIKLGKLPERTPVKLAINVDPELNRVLARYREFYQATYHQDESIADLVPAIVHAFIHADKAFLQWCRNATDQNG